MWTFFRILLLLVLFGAAPGGAWAGERAALVIGNGAYGALTPLANAVRDAEDVAAALGRIGYGVTLVRDGDLQAMNDGLRAFLRAADRAESAAIFYAGHGVQAGGRNYLVPVGARIADELDLDTQTVSLDKLLGLLDGAGARVKIVILDSCRDNPLARSLTRGGGTRGLARIDLEAGSAKGTLIAFSTAPGAVAQDGQGRNSPFTQALLGHIETPGLDIRQMFGQVRADVDQATGGAQTPWVNEAIVGTFSFASTTPGAAVTQAVPAVAAETAPAKVLAALGAEAPRHAEPAVASVEPAPVEPTTPAGPPNPSFSCLAALTPVEQAICADSSLSDLDRGLAATFGRVLADADEDGRAELLAAQRGWLAERNACLDVACVGQSYRARVASLEAALGTFDASAVPDPSFSCRARLNEAERAVCSNVALARLDRELSGAYAATVRLLGPPQRKRLAAEQKAWIFDRDSCRGDPACIAGRYTERLGVIARWAMSAR